MSAPAEAVWCSRCHEGAGFVLEDGAWVSECCAYPPIPAEAPDA